MKGMNDLLRQAQLMQNRMAKLQEELEEREVEASSGGGMVKVVANGKQQILSITMEKEAVNPEDVEMLQDLTLAAVNEALRLSREMAEREMSELTGGLKIPGLM
jgi:DNA-binding YbaB/EbfC family protein